MSQGSERIYLDYHATTPVDPRVLDAMLPFFTVKFGNASSRDHTFGDEAETAVERARFEIGELLGVPPRWVTFTSGATEAINLALSGFAKALAAAGKQGRFAITSAEHSAVLDTAKSLADDGLIRLTILPVDPTGHVQIEALEQACRFGLDLISVIAANNEVGTITDIGCVSSIARNYDVLLLSDATQAVGKIDISAFADSCDMMALSAHKFYGPKGIGALVLGPGISVKSVQHGGQHERGMRSGTLNVPAIVGFGEAARLRKLEMIVDEKRVASLRDLLQNLLMEHNDGMLINGRKGKAERLPGNLHISLPGIPNQAVIARVRHRLALSTGSACSSGIEAPSHVLRAMGLSQQNADGSLRFGLGKYLTEADIRDAAAIVTAAVLDVRARLV